MESNSIKTVLNSAFCVGHSLANAARWRTGFEHFVSMTAYASGRLYGVIYRELMTNEVKRLYSMYAVKADIATDVSDYEGIAEAFVRQLGSEIDLDKFTNVKFAAVEDLHTYVNPLDCSKYNLTVEDIKSLFYSIRSSDKDYMWSDYKFVIPYGPRFKILFVATISNRSGEYSTNFEISPNCTVPVKAPNGEAGLFRHVDFRNLEKSELQLFEKLHEAGLYSTVHNLTSLVNDI